MTQREHDQLVSWILAEHVGGHLSGANLVDVCSDATTEIGCSVSVEDYIAARRDPRVVAALGPCVGQARDTSTHDEPPSLRQRRPEPLAPPLASLPPEAARKAIIGRVVDATLRVCCVTPGHFLAPGQGFRDVSAARNIIAFTLAGLLPDETVDGLAMLLAENVGQSDQAWHKRLDRAACARKPKLAALQARVDDLLDDIEPLRGVVVRKVVRPRKVLLAAEVTR